MQGGRNATTRTVSTKLLPTCSDTIHAVFQNEHTLPIYPVFDVECEDPPDGKKTLILRSVQRSPGNIFSCIGGYCVRLDGDPARPVAGIPHKNSCCWRPRLSSGNRSNMVL